MQSKIRNKKLKKQSNQDKDDDTFFFRKYLG